VILWWLLGGVVHPRVTVEIDVMKVSSELELKPEQLRFVRAVAEKFGPIAKAAVECVYLDGAKRLIGLNDYETAAVVVLAHELGVEFPLLEQ
jgi:hypothetical protein